MKETLKHISDETLEKLFIALNDAYSELRIELDENRNDNSFYWKLLTFSVIIDNEYWRREKEKEDTQC